MHIYNTEQETYRRRGLLIGVYCCGVLIYIYMRWLTAVVMIQGRVLTDNIKCIYSTRV